MLCIVITLSLVNLLLVRVLGFTPPKGSYMSTSVGGVQYFVFNDRKEVCFVTNMFPEGMNSKVYRLEHDGLLREQSVPPTLTSL